MSFIDTMMRWWDKHGTKILGFMAATGATIQSILALLTANPDVHLLVTPKQFAYLSVFSGVMGVLTIRRGYQNTKNNPPNV